MAVAVLGHSRHRTRQIPHRGWMPPGAPTFASITPPNKRGNPEGATRVWWDGDALNVEQYLVGRSYGVVPEGCVRLQGFLWQRSKFLREPCGIRNEQGGT